MVDRDSPPSPPDRQVLSADVIQGPWQDPSPSLTVAAALSYARAGLLVLPVLDRAPTKDTSKIAAVWRHWPQANVGIATGPESGVFVVIVRANAKSRLLPLSLTRQALSPLGARHHYFVWPRDGETIRSGAIDDDIEVVGADGWVLAPPSKTDDGSYQWLNNER